ncbi:BON domain-containing protein [Pannus brasiliensis CCIBt3594]|uniref:BON domain-containing protein n=1 Tax=Pannus brasiliensis CCIBt3594 TaxID=1427578 RepID=A0AAW9QIN8_9CHRO
MANWLKRIFGMDKPANPAAAIAGQATSSDIPPHKVGLDGTFDESGLAKRVVLAFDEDPDVADEDRLWVAQTQSVVVLKGTVSDQATLDKMVSIARGVNGATEVDTSQVTIG